ncbi:MAG TPA: SLBB domain-containing protein, partial [Actinomycetota bacterium]|nr:SLBB domain-containing protein [Actinomycetota bacterium]
MLEFRPRELAALAALSLIVAGGAVFAFARTMPRPGEPAAAAATRSLAPIETLAPSPSSPATLFVHVAGAVRAPGVYEFAAGARVADALRAAGGATGEADANSINLARPLSDGERIYVPRRGETPPPDPGGAGGGGG